MLKRVLLTCCMLMLFVGCGKTPPPPPEPTIVVVEFSADEELNPDSQGRPSPLVIGIYQLKYYEAFENADYNALYDDDAGSLGKGLIAKREIILQPGEKKTELLREVSDQAQAIGFMGQFRNENAQWRTTTGIRPHKTTVIRVHASGTAIISQLQVTQ
ncbi:type VI secretion system lipoprotein TssJ [uncultured Desulfobacter sp.]|uniref:type VI secretion system lipoprotein TssJ n=1 Tax=uncultured Desulfobacter sp. TaxID=240139 RepID=UPI0029F4925D|nr:type VI secretion system lipoprotein TssJ [uncultured Desulfobacter sp.]